MGVPGMTAGTPGPNRMEIIEMKLNNVFALVCWMSVSVSAVAESEPTGAYPGALVSGKSPGGYVIKGNTIFTVTMKGELLVADFLKQIVISDSLDGRGPQISKLGYDGPLLDDDVVHLGWQGQQKSSQCNAEAEAAVAAIRARQAACTADPEGATCQQATVTAELAMGDYVG